MRPTGNTRSGDFRRHHARLLDRISGSTGTTVVMATHDRGIVDTMRRRVVELDRGSIVRDQVPWRSAEWAGPGMKAEYYVPRDGLESGAQCHHHSCLDHDGGRVPGAGRRLADAAFRSRERHRRWQGGIEFVIFMQPNPTQEQIGRGTGLVSSRSPEVSKIEFVNKKEAYEELQGALR